MYLPDALIAIGVTLGYFAAACWLISEERHGLAFCWMAGVPLACGLLLKLVA